MGRRIGYLDAMAEHPEILTAEYLSSLSPNERSAAIRERVVTDEDENPELVAWARAQYQAMLEASS